MRSVTANHQVALDFLDQPAGLARVVAQYIQVCLPYLLNPGFYFGGFNRKDQHTCSGFP